jgi:hypothetical protein
MAHLSQEQDPSAPDDLPEVDVDQEDLAFRPHHLRPNTKQAASFTSCSSYASDTDSDRADDDNENTRPDSDMTTEAAAAAATASPPPSSAKSHPRDQARRPGGGTLQWPAGKAHDWYSGGRITSHGRWFRDSQNRTLLLRGVNLCGNSKLPTTPNGSSHLSEGFFDHRNVCFLGRPFPRDQADEHFSRLKRWGLTFVRLLVPWEALEHSGP